MMVIILLLFENAGVDTMDSAKRLSSKDNGTRETPEKLLVCTALT
jgi:hypothetical protein